MGQKRPPGELLPPRSCVEVAPKAELRPKARRTGPAIPVSVVVCATGSLPPPCFKKSLPSRTSASRHGHGVMWGVQSQEQQEDEEQQQQMSGSDEPQPMNADRPVSPDAPKGEPDQQEQPPPETPQQPQPDSAPPRKAVRFAPGPLTPPPRAQGAPPGFGAQGRSSGGTSSTRSVSEDGHPASEGRGAVPIYRTFLNASFSTDPITRSNIALLEELLGPENAPSLGRLKRRAGLLPPARPPRVQLTARQGQQRQVE